MTRDQLKETYRVLKSNHAEALACGQTGSAADYSREMATVKASYQKLQRQARARSARADAYRSCGLVRVVGACGGVYWE